MPLILRKAQKLACEYMRVFPGFGLFMEQGVGKTLPTLFTILELALRGEIESALVVAPKAAMGAWFRDIEKFRPHEQEVLREVVTVINYDMVWRKGKGYDRLWDLIVLDESHKIKNRTSRRSKFLLRLAVTARFRYILTGTPVGNGQLENIWSQICFLDPYVNKRGVICSNIFKREWEERDGVEYTGSYREFEDRYCILNKYYKPYRYRNVDELQEIITSYTYRVLKSECTDLPKKLPDEVFDIELKEPKLYKELHKHSTVEELEILAENPLARMTKLRQVCSGFLNDGTTTHELKCEKLSALEDFLDGWSKKLVIFAEYKLSIRKISELLTRLKIKHVVLDGEQKDKLIWRKFQSDDSIQVIVCQYQSASAGIDLFAASTTIYYEPTLSSTTLDQSRDRTHRTGQTEPCQYIHFVTKGTIEEAIFKALQNFSDFGEKLFQEYMQEYVRSYSGGR